MNQPRIKKSLLVFVPLIIFGCLVGALMVALHHGVGAGNKFALHIDEAAPATNLPVLESSGVTFSTADWRGRAYVVNFFASWCVPCHAEHETLWHLAQAHIPLIGIAFKDKSDSVSAFLAKEGNPFLAVAEDRTGHTGIDWGLTGVPETFIIDGEGVIRFHFVGPLTDEVITEQFLPIWKETQK